MRPLPAILLLAACTEYHADKASDPGVPGDSPTDTDVARDSDAAVDTEPNQAPTVTLVGPLDGTVVKADHLTRMTAEVSDPDDPLGSLEIVWSSDTEGPLGTSMTDAAGGTSIAVSQ